MIRWQLGIDAAGPVSGVNIFLRLAWPRLLLLALIVAGAAYAAYLYRAERGLSRRRRLLLTGLRAAVLALLLLMFWAPAVDVSFFTKLRRSLVVLVDCSESMDIADTRKTAEEIIPVARATGRLAWDADEKTLPDAERSELARVKRLEIAKEVLAKTLPDILAAQKDNLDVSVFAFDKEIRPLKGDGSTADRVRALAANGKSTFLGDSVVRAAESFAGRPMAGVLILSDGASNGGLEPLKVAAGMKERALPLYTVGIGLPSPPDVRVHGLVAAETAFIEDKAIVRAQVAGAGYAGRAVNVSLRLDGKEMDSKRVTLTDGPQFVELAYEPKAKADAAKIEVVVPPLENEVGSENNTAAKTVRIVDDKIKVLFIEGKPRWEYRYLRRVLLRDRRLDVKFLMTKGDKELAEASPQYIDTFPVDSAGAFAFDLVILGDVPASYFTRAQLEKIEELVLKRRGSFLMIAGFEHAPAEYLGTPIENLLTVKPSAEGCRKVGDQVAPRVTEEGAQSSVTKLEGAEDENRDVWERVRPLFRLPVLESVKKGAVVLVDADSFAPGMKSYPLVSWQRYGNGKSMFIATDQLWRLRFKTGDKYHVRFWSQAIQFLALSKALAGNQRAIVELDRGECNLGDSVRISADVLNEAYEPERGESYPVKIRAPDGAVSDVKLAAVKGVPGAFQGYFPPPKPGRYEVLVTGPDAAERPPRIFEVADVPVEAVETSMQERLLRQMAEQSGGRYFGLSELRELGKTLAGESKIIPVQKEADLWDRWPPLVLILLLLAAEWFLRRRYDLV